MQVRLSIDRKLAMIIAFACVSAIAASTVAIVLRDISAFRQARTEEVASLARIVGMNSATATASKDHHGAERELAVLGTVPHVRSAAIYGPDGRIFAVLHSGSMCLIALPDTAPAPGVAIAFRQMMVTESILLDNQPVGCICILSNTRDISAHCRNDAIINAIILLAAGFLGFAATARLRRRVTDPVKAFAQTADEMLTRNDFSLRVREDESDDGDLRALATSLNRMLAHVQDKVTTLERDNKALESRAAQRASDLEEEIATRKRTEEEHQNLLQKLAASNKELNDFAYVVSHDLKAPIRAINSLADWLSADCADKLDNEDKEKLALLVSRTKRMHDLINGILEYSRIGRVKDQAVDTNLNELLKDVVDILAPPEDMQIMIQKDLPTVRYDKTRMMQVFQNLIGNAVKYMDKPKGIIKVICADEGSYWQFTIRDNGPGIHWKYFDKIFQLFQTLAPRDQSESTGVGLTLVKKIVTTWGGKIWVESEVGVGSSFIFTLLKT
jgi:signal transduction histidine kinase